MLTNNPTIKNLFTILDDAILKINSAIERHYLKDYIAYKEDGDNFVSIIPQKQGLKLYMTIGYDDIIDPRGICKNVAGKEHWGTGDTNFAISSAEEIDYAINLIKQSFDSLD